MNEKPTNKENSLIPDFWFPGEQSTAKKLLRHAVGVICFALVFAMTLLGEDRHVNERGLATFAALSLGVFGYGIWLVCRRGQSKAPIASESNEQTSAPPIDAISLLAFRKHRAIGTGCIGLGFVLVVLTTLVWTRQLKWSATGDIMTILIPLTSLLLLIWGMFLVYLYNNCLKVRKSRMTPGELMIENAGHTQHFVAIWFSIAAIGFLFGSLHSAMSDSFLGEAGAVLLAVPMGICLLLALFSELAAKKTKAQAMAQFEANERAAAEKAESDAKHEQLAQMLASMKAKGGGSLTCPSCGTAVLSGTKFCPECGAPMNCPCPKCGASVPAGTKFCPECGEKQA